MARWFRAPAAVALAWWLVACPSTDGFSGGDGLADVVTLPDAADASSSDASAADAAPPAPRCDPTKPFSTPVAVGPVDDGMTNVHSGRLSNDELTLFYVKDLPIGDAGNESLDGDIYMATRASTTDPFGVGAIITAINSSADDEDPYLLDDGLTLWFTSARVLPLQFFVSHRASLTAPFTTPTIVSNQGITYDVINLSFTPDAGAAYFTISGMSNDINRAQVTEDGGIRNPFEQLNPPNDGSQWPCVTGDELTMLYDYEYHGGVWMTTRTSTSVAFTDGAPVVELNGDGGLPGAYTQPTWISHDGCDIVIQTNSAANGRAKQIYTAHRGM